VWWATVNLLPTLPTYFALGIKSCWLVDPSLKNITVYNSPKESKTYDMSDGEVVDNILDIRLPLNKVFAKKTVIKASVK